MRHFWQFAHLVSRLERLIAPPGMPAKTAAMLKAHGFDVLRVPTTEFAKADGGVTCLALVW